MHYAQCEMEPNAYQLKSLHHHVHGSIEMSQLVSPKNNYSKSSDLKA